MNTLSMRKVLAVVAIVGFGALQSTASALFIEGAVGFGGQFATTGGVAGTGDATGIDIFGAFVIVGAGDYAGTGGSTVTFNHVDFAPANTPVTPLWSFTSGMTSYSFDLNTIMVDFQDNNELALSGEGVLRITGLEDTLGSWVFTGQSSGMLFTFSSGASSIPEPTTLLLLGAGLIGFATTRRRRS